MPNQQLNDALHKKLDSLLDRLTCLEAGQRTVIPGHHSSPVANTVVKSGSLRRKGKLNANYCHTEGPLLDSSSTKKHTTLSTSRPSYGKQTNMGLDASIICGGQRTALDLGSSSPVLSGRDKVNCLEASDDDSPNRQRGQSSLCDTQGWNLTPVLNRDQIQTSFASTVSSSSEAMSPLHVRNKLMMVKAPEPSFNLPELIDTLRNNSHSAQDASGKVSDKQRHEKKSPQQHGNAANNMAIYDRNLYVSIYNSAPNHRNTAARLLCMFTFSSCSLKCIRNTLNITMGQFKTSIYHIIFMHICCSDIK